MGTFRTYIEMGIRVLYNREIYFSEIVLDIFALFAKNHRQNKGDKLSPCEKKSRYVRTNFPYHLVISRELPGPGSGGSSVTLS